MGHHWSSSIPGEFQKFFLNKCSCGIPRYSLGPQLTMTRVYDGELIQLNSLKSLQQKGPCLTWRDGLSSKAIELKNEPGLLFGHDLEPKICGSRMPSSFCKCSWIYRWSSAEQFIGVGKHVYHTGGHCLYSGGQQMGICCEQSALQLWYIALSTLALGDNPFFTWINNFFEWIIWNCFEWIDYLNE